MGSRVTKTEFRKRYDEAAVLVYRQSPITRGADELAGYLLSRHWKLAILSSSPTEWIDQVLVRLPWRDNVHLTVSLNEHPRLRPKPSPDGYRYVLSHTGSAAERSIALEDSNYGITSAKRGGLYTIGYREYLPEGYAQRGADAAADSMAGVLNILSRARALLPFSRK